MADQQQISGDSIPVERLHALIIAFFMGRHDAGHHRMQGQMRLFQGVQNRGHGGQALFQFPAALAVKPFAERTLMPVGDHIEPGHRIVQEVGRHIGRPDEMGVFSLEQSQFGLAAAVQGVGNPGDVADDFEIINSVQAEQQKNHPKGKAQFIHKPDVSPTHTRISREKFARLAARGAADI